MERRSYREQRRDQQIAYRMSFAACAALTAFALWRSSPYRPELSLKNNLLNMQVRVWNRKEIPPESRRYERALLGFKLNEEQFLYEREEERIFWRTLDVPFLAVLGPAVLMLLVGLAGRQQYRLSGYRPPPPGPATPS